MSTDLIPWTQRCAEARAAIKQHIDSLYDHLEEAGAATPVLLSLDDSKLEVLGVFDKLVADSELGGKYQRAIWRFETDAEAMAETLPEFAKAIREFLNGVR